VQKWLDIIRGGYALKAVEHLKTGTRPPFPYSDVRLLPYLQHSFWFLPNVAACQSMANLLAEKHNTFWHQFEIVLAAGASAGDRAGRVAAGPQGHRVRVRDQNDHAILRQTHDRRDRASVVIHPDAAQSEKPRDLLSGRVPRAVAVVNQEPQWRRPK
jgi:hypothetical protein